MLVTLLVRTGLDTMTPDQTLGDIMTDDAYRDDHEKEEKKEKKDEKKDEKKKSMAFKATSSKSKANQILCLLCSTLLGVWSVMPISA